KTMEPIPAIAESWELSKDGTEYIFHLRKNAKFSNGEPVTAKDFVYSFRRALSPELASRNANLAYDIKYAEAYNSDRAFVKNSDGTFVHKSEMEEKKDAPAAAETPAHETVGADTEFHKYLDEPERLSVPNDEKERNKVLDKDAKLKALIAGKE